MAETSATILLAPADAGPWGDRTTPTHLVRLLQGSMPAWVIHKFHGVERGDAPAPPVTVGVAPQAHHPVVQDLVVLLAATVLGDESIANDPEVTAVTGASGDRWAITDRGFGPGLVERARAVVAEQMVLHVTVLSPRSTLVEDGSLDLLASWGVPTVVYEPR